MQSRTTFNAIRRLVLPSGEIITDPQAIKVAAADHFARFLYTNVVSTHGDIAETLLNLIEFRCPAHTAELLVHPISEAEIRNVLFSMPANKAPGPDGYPVEFYKAAWSVIFHYCGTIFLSLWFPSKRSECHDLNPHTEDPRSRNYERF